LLGFGSRSWTDAVLIGAVLDVLRPSVVVEGESPGGGADILFRQEADRRNIQVLPRPIDPGLDGRRRCAPLSRNGRMLLDNPDRAVGCISGRMGSMFSPGSADMLQRCRAAGIPVIVFREDGHSIYQAQRALPEAA
jgi:hypothetical protein